MNNNNHNPSVITWFFKRYPYIGFSTLILFILSVTQFMESRTNPFEKHTNWGFTLMIINLIAYFLLKNLKIFKRRSPLERRVENAIRTARLHSVEKDEDYEIETLPKFTVQEDENTVVIMINGLVDKLEKDYEKAIPVFENILDLDVTEWKYQRGKVRIVLSKYDMDADYFYKSEDPAEYLTLGIDNIQGEVHWHYNRFPHMLLVGGTGSGKSTMFKSVIAQMPRDWELFFCDPKQVEFAELLYEGYRVAFSNDEIKHSIDTVVELMENRYAEMRQRRVKEYRELNGEMKPCFLIIDEFAAFFSLLDSGKGKDAEQYTRKLRTLVQKGRAAGVQLILMTQKPSSKVLDTDTRDNLMCQVAMGSNKTESYVMAFGDEGRECSPLGIGQGYYNIGDGIRKMKTYNLSTAEFIENISAGINFDK